MFGIMGKIAKVDLSNGDVQAEVLSESIHRKFIGGTGLAAYLLSQHSYNTLNPLGPENVLVFTTGPFTGTNVPTSARYAVAAKSPLTGLWGEADSGSRFGISLKKAGYDALVITGKSEDRVYLLIDERSIAICPAEELWGKDTYETFRVLQNRHGAKAGVVCIGPAGEKLLPLACIMSEGTNGRAAGRTGLGSVMGSKQLKAIVSCGNLSVPVFNTEALKESVKKIVPSMIEKQKRMRDYGTAGAV
jgi:aldehyde:ferredoxin oxidoreductase